MSSRAKDPVLIDQVWYIALPTRVIETYEFCDCDEADGSLPLDAAIELLRTTAEGYRLPRVSSGGDYDSSWLEIDGYRLATEDEISDYIKRRDDKAERIRQNKAIKDLRRAESKRKADLNALERVRREFPELLKDDNAGT